MILCFVSGQVSVMVTDAEEVQAVWTRQPEVVKSSGLGV